MTPQPHSLHTLAALPDDADSTGWGCACGHTGTAPDADAAIAGHAQHVADATYLVRALDECMRPGWFANNYEGTTS